MGVDPPDRGDFRGSLGLKSQREGTTPSDFRLTQPDFDRTPQVYGFNVHTLGVCLRAEGLKGCKMGRTPQVYEADGMFGTTNSWRTPQDPGKMALTQTILGDLAGC